MLLNKQSMRPVDWVWMFLRHITDVFNVAKFGDWWSFWMDINIICFVRTGRKKDFLLFPFLLLFQCITWEIFTIKLEKQLITRKDVGILRNPKMYHVENMVPFQYIYALVKHRSRKMMCWHYRIALKFDRHHLGSLSTFQQLHESQQILRSFYLGSASSISHCFVNRGRGRHFT